MGCVRYVTHTTLPLRTLRLRGDLPKVTCLERFSAWSRYLSSLETPVFTPSATSFPFFFFKFLWGMQEYLYLLAMLLGYSCYLFLIIYGMLTMQVFYIFPCVKCHPSTKLWCRSCYRSPFRQGRTWDPEALPSSHLISDKTDKWTRFCLALKLMFLNTTTSRFPRSANEASWALGVAGTSLYSGKRNARAGRSLRGHGGELNRWGNWGTEDLATSNNLATL